MSKLYLATDSNPVEMQVRVGAHVIVKLECLELWAELFWELTESESPSEGGGQDVQRLMLPLLLGLRVVQRYAGCGH